MVGQERHSVVELANSERLQAAHSLVIVRAVHSSRGLGSRADRGELGDIGHDNERADELASIARLRLLHTLGAQDDLQAARNAAARQLGLHLLDAHLLEVHELGVVQVEVEALTVGALRVAARRRLRVLELLHHVLDHGLAVEADEGAADQLGVHGMCAGHLGCDAHQRADLDR